MLRAENGWIGELVLANRILANENVIDIFGHVSMRDPEVAEHFLLSRARSPIAVGKDDIVVFDLDGERVTGADGPFYAERVIHSAIYRARPDVHAVCHLHAPAIMPFAITGVPIVPVFHVGAVIGEEVPFWDSRDEFGDTNLLVSTEEEGRSLARALGPHSVVLMRRHGATVVGCSLREVVFRAVQLEANAKLQAAAAAIGPPSPLRPAEIEKAAELNLRPSILARAWDFWCVRLEGAAPPNREH